MRATGRGWTESRTLPALLQQLREAEQVRAAPSLRTTLPLHRLPTGTAERRQARERGELSADETSAPAAAADETSAPAAAAAEREAKVSGREVPSATNVMAVTDFSSPMQQPM